MRICSLSVLTFSLNVLAEKECFGSTIASVLVVLEEGVALAARLGIAVYLAVTIALARGAPLPRLLGLGVSSCLFGSSCSSIC